jgi:hypothetical protein
MSDPITQLVSAIGTPAGILLVWWLLSRDFRSLKDLIDARLKHIEEDLEGIRQAHRDCSVRAQGRIDDCVRQISRLEGEMNS